MKQNENAATAEQREKFLSGATGKALRVLATTRPPFLERDQEIATAKRIMAVTDAPIEPTPRQFRYVATLSGFELPCPPTLFWDRVVDAFRVGRNGRGSGFLGTSFNDPFKALIQPHYAKFADQVEAYATALHAEAEDLIEGRRDRAELLAGKLTAMPTIQTIWRCAEIVREHLKLDSAGFRKETPRILPAILKPRALVDDFSNGVICEQLAREETIATIKALVEQGRSPEYQAILAKLQMPTVHEFRACITQPVLPYEWRAIVTGEGFTQAKVRPFYERAIIAAEEHAAALVLELQELAAGTRTTPSLTAGKGVASRMPDTIRKCAAVLREHLAANEDDFRKLTRPIISAVLKPHRHAVNQGDNYSSLPLTEA